MKALATNRLASSPQYAKILHEYNQEFEKTKGRVNNAKFYKEVILPVLPNYHIQSWYQFLRRFRTTAGLVLAQLTTEGPRSISKIDENRLHDNLLNNEIATRLGLQRALNIGATRLQDVLENPQLMTTRDAINLLFKAMKAQDSRIHAIGKIREDSRAQEKFERTFIEATYGD